MSIKPNHLPAKKLEKIWAQVPPDYYDVGIAKNPLQKIWHSKKLAEVLKLLPRQAKKILDVGCSSGVLTARVAKYLPKSKVTGLDSYQKAVNFAKSKYPKIKFVAGDAHKLPFKDKAFDLIICTETLEHVTDPKGVLLEIKRVLSKNGAALISMDTGNWLFHLVWFFWTKTRGRVWQDAHLHEFNSKILEDLIKEAGFRIKKKVLSHLGMSITFLAVPEK